MLSVLRAGAGAVPGVTRAGAVAQSVIELPRRLDRLSDTLVRLAELGESVDRLTVSVESLTELTQYAATLPELTRHAAALPELAPRVRSVELMVERIIDYLETLQPTVDELTQAASDLQHAVGPIGRLAGRMPGSKPRVVAVEDASQH